MIAHQILSFFMFAHFTIAIEPCDDCSSVFAGETRVVQSYQLIEQTRFAKLPEGRLDEKDAPPPPPPPSARASGSIHFSGYNSLPLDVSKTSLLHLTYTSIVFFLVCTISVASCWVAGPVPLLFVVS